jgi:hypothetical protein
MASMPTPKTAAVVLGSEDEEALGEVTASVLQVDETRQDLHVEVDNTIKNITQGAVHAARRLDDPPILGHMGDQPLDAESLGAPSDTHT